MKKCFLSPFFTPLFFILSWGAILAVVLIFFPEKKFEVTTEGNIIDIATYVGYALMLLTMLYCVKDFRGKMLDWSLYFMLGVAALLREAGIQHHLTKTDTTPFKSRFFLNPNNALSEKILYGAILLIIFGTLIYFAVKYAKKLIITFFKKDTITWSVATFCTVLVFSKFADRFPSNYRHAHNLESLPRSLIDIWSLLEESSEIFLPLIVVIIFIQYHFFKKENQA